MAKKRSPSPNNEGVSDALARIYATRVPQIDLKQEIMSALHSIARQQRCAIKNFHWQTYPLSFHWVELDGAEGQFSLLIEEGSPFAALCRAVPPVGEKLDFFDDQSFAEAADSIQAPFSFMPAASLGKDLTAADRAFVANLSDRHASDLKYWKPETVGDVVFNFWD